MGTTEKLLLANIAKELHETNRLLAVIAGRHEHRWVGPDMDGPMRCRICGEAY
jgi:hypothetical protein